MKKYRRVLAAVLAVLLLLPVLVGCQSNDASDNKEQETPINPDLVAALGEEWAEEEKDTIVDIVGALEKSYTEYQKDKNVYKFITNVENAMNPYAEYMSEEIRSALAAVKDAPATEENALKQAKLSTLLLKSNFHLPIDLQMYKFNVDSGVEPDMTEQEVEAAVIDYINAISEFFYAKPIVEDSQ